MILILAMESRTHEQLLAILNSLFSRDSLRRNVYLFNSLNPAMELPIKTVLRERRVAALTNDPTLVLEALKQCELVEVISQSLLRVQMRGDPLLVRVSHLKAAPTRKDILVLTKPMRCEVREEKNSIVVEMQSEPAVHELVERIKAQDKGWEWQVQQKSPYHCLQDSISNIRKQKRANKQQQEVPPPAQNYFNYELMQYYSQHYPLFIRRAVDSSDQQKPEGTFSHKNSHNGHSNGHNKQYVQKGKEQSGVRQQPRARFDSDQFPSFDSPPGGTQK